MKFKKYMMKEIDVKQYKNNQNQKVIYKRLQNIKDFKQCINL